MVRHGEFLAVVVFGLLLPEPRALPLEIMLFGFLTVFFLQAFPTILSSCTPELFPRPRCARPAWA